MLPNTLIKSFKEKKIPATVIFDQVRSQLLWNKLISLTVANNITITEKQKEEAFQNFLKNSGEVEYNISEIFVSFSTANTGSTSKARIDEIYEKVNNTNFVSMVQQFSDGAINLNNWIRESMLNDNIASVIKELNIGEITAPIESTVGHHIYILNDKRKTQKIIENEALYNLSQIFFKVSKKDSESNSQYIEILDNLRNTIRSCQQLENTLSDIEGASGGNLGLLSERSLNVKFLNVVKNGLLVGKLSQEITTNEGIHSIMLCEPALKVDYATLKNNLEQKLKVNKINDATDLLLNRIRQRALIEIVGN